MGAPAHRDGRTRGIIEAARDAFISLDASGRVVDWSQSAERTFGWRRDEVLGRSLADTVIPASEAAAWRKFLDTGGRGLLGTHVTFPAQHRDGHQFPVEAALWSTGVGTAVTYHAFLHDTSDRRAADRALHHLAAIVESATDAIFSTTLDGRVLTWNGGAERIFGFRSEQMVERPVFAIVPDDRTEEMTADLAEIAAGRSVSRETVRCCENRSPIEVALILSPIRDSRGNVSGASTIARDITEQRWMATTLDATLAALETALDEARESEARSRRFLADAAHQLQSPITGIRATAETLLLGASPEDVDRLLVSLARETERAARLSTALLKMARLDRGESAARASADPMAICSGEVERARVQSPQLDIRLEWAGPPRCAQLDVNAVQEIVANLLDNARRHARAVITVGVEADDRGVTIRVGDDGPGLAPELVDRVFERFVSLDGLGGSGLGLPIARGHARAHGGDLRYEHPHFVLDLPTATTPPA